MKPLFYKPFLLTLFGFFIYGNIFAQANVVGAGGNVNAAEGTVSYTIGQPVTNHLDSPGHSLNEGLQQPYELFVVSTYTDLETGLSAEVFPNPTSDYLILRMLSSQNKSATRYAITDINGMPMASKDFEETEINIPMKEFTPGTYILTLFNAKKPVHQFKIIKL